MIAPDDEGYDSARAIHEYLLAVGREREAMR
jgi:hypothetical protein